MPASAVPIVLAIDVEHDGRAGRPGSGIPLEGFRRTLAWLNRARPRLEDATSSRVTVSWFLRMDPQIAVLAGTPDALVRAAPEAFDDLLAREDALGLHTHAGRWTGTEWLADHGDPAWIEHCLETSAAAFAATFSRRCREHRFGDRFSSPAMFDALARLGITVDLTVEPGKHGARRLDPTVAATGNIPSYLRAARDPSPHPSGRLWLLPLTSTDPGPALAAPRRFARRLRHPGSPLHRPLQLDRAWRHPADAWDLAERRLAEMSKPYLAFALRSDITLTPWFERTAAVLEALGTHPLARHLQFASGTGTLERLGLVAPSASASQD